MSDTRWCLIESDPGVFTELIERFGVKGLSVEELVALDAAALEQYTKVYGLIFLHKWKANRDSHRSGAAVSGSNGEIYFAKQVISDACATLALVNLLCNHPNAELGEGMQNFLNFTQDLDPFLRGTQIADYEPFRTAHNSFASPYLIEEEVRPATDKDDVYHFISYVYRNGTVWELDGLQEGPIPLAECDERSYLATMVGVVERRVHEMTVGEDAGDLSFSLMAVVDDPIIQTRNKIEQLRRQEKAIGDLENMLQTMVEERERQRAENARRHHNYFPMIVELLKAFAEKGILDDIAKEAQTKAGES